MLTACVAPPTSGSPQVLDLTGSAWQLKAIHGVLPDQATASSQISPAPAMPLPTERYTLRFEAAGKASFRLDCNRGFATWQATPLQGETGDIGFGPIATTRKLCPADSLDRQVLSDLQAARSYRLGVGRLELIPATGRPVYEWEPLVER